MARRPKRSLVDELALHITLTQSVQASCDVLRQLYPDVPEFRTAVAVLDLAEKDLSEKKSAAAVAEKAPEPKPAALDLRTHDTMAGTSEDRQT